MEEIGINNLISRVNRIGIFVLFPWFIICLIGIAAFSSVDTDTGKCSCAVIFPFLLYPLWLAIFIKLSNFFLTKNKPIISLLFSALPIAISLAPLLMALVIKKV